MFGFRSDGKKVKGMNIIDKAGPFFMNQRIDAVNYYKAQIPCAPMDEFIAREMPDFNMSKILFTNSKNVVVGDIMIDDNVKNLLTNKSYQKLLFSAEHNDSMGEDELRAHNLVRVNNWEDILKILM